MSSSRPAESRTPEPARSRWRPRPLSAWSLRTRLVAAVTALLAVVCLAIGGVTTVAMRHVLISQLDRQLTAAAVRARPDHDDDHRSRELFPPGQPAGTLAARIVDGTVARADTFTPDADDLRQPVPAAQQRVLADLPADGRPRTRELGPLGGYRVVARSMPDGGVLVTGLPMDQVERTVWWMVIVEAVVAGTGLLIAGGVGALIVRSSLRPLRRVAATATRVAELPLDRGEVALSVRVPASGTDPHTEVGQVGAALNHMLEHVATALAARHASETRVRQFVADASHELRTPLAAIRGYAELTRRGRDEVPPDVRYALGRVESESLRMTALVEDMLLLARLDAGRPLATDPVDLTALLVDAVSDAHAAGPEHHWRLDVPDEAVPVTGDAARLHQVVANLLGNARTHTPPGTTVTAALSADAAGGATITVTDDGPGIPAELQADVFDRFARGDSSRSRAAGSTGLGLAIVAAVVAAHHGSVAVDSRPGRTVFTVKLPAAEPAAAAGAA